MAPQLTSVRRSSGSYRRLRRRRSVLGLVLSGALVFAAVSPLAFAKNGKSEKHTTSKRDVGVALTVQSSDPMYAPMPTKKKAPGALWDVEKRIRSDKVGETGAGVQIAMIDTGVVDVPALRHSNIVIGPDFSFEDQVPELRGRDTNGHGTHLAGVMVAADAAWVAGDHNKKPGRVLGIAPDAELISIKVAAADGAVDVTQVIAAINWVIENRNAPGFDIRVLNLAYGTDGAQDYRVDPLSHAVERAWHAGIVVVVAAGNNGPEGGLVNPALNPFVIVAGGSDAGNGWQDAVAGYSSDTPEVRGVDVVAPGSSIISVRNPRSYSDEFNVDGRLGDGSFVRGSGTSQASAVVSASVALLLEARPELTPDEVKAALMVSADKIKDDSTAIGYLNVQHAMKADVDGFVQSWERSTGTGSIALARGSHVLVVDGVALDGDVDVFGNSWTGNSWTIDAWTGNSWTGNSWTGNSWTGNSWTGNSWTGNSWTGNSWTGNSWTSQTGNSWTGNSWTGNSWTGNSWTGNSWTGNSWTGNSWTGNSWTGNSWTSL